MGRSLLMNIYDHNRCKYCRLFWKVEKNLRKIDEVQDVVHLIHFRSLKRIHKIAFPEFSSLETLLTNHVTLSNNLTF